MVDKLIDEIKELQANIEKEKDDELTCLLRHDVAIGQGGREISDEDIQSIFYFH